MDLILILMLAVAFVLGAFLGVLLGRRSATANKVVDRVRAEADELREQLRQARAQLHRRE